MGFREEIDSPFEIGRRWNSKLSALLSFYLLFSCFNILLDGNLTWSFYGFSILLLVFVPPVYFEDRSALVPFEILLLLSLPFTLKGMEIGLVASHTLNYISASAVALLVVTELDTFTSFRTNSFFSVLFISFTTVAVSGLWAVTRWLSDIFTGTSLIASERILMWEFTAALIAGTIAGFFFKFYLKDRAEEVLNV